MNWTIKVERKSSVPLRCDLDVLDNIGISYTGTSKVSLTDQDKIKIFNTLDFSVNGYVITIYL